VRGSAGVLGTVVVAGLALFVALAHGTAARTDAPALPRAPLAPAAPGGTESGPGPSRAIALPPRAPAAPLAERVDDASAPEASLASIVCRVVLGDGTPTAGARVLLGEGAFPRGTVRVDGQGLARFGALAPGRYVLELDPTSLAPGLLVPPSPVTGASEVELALGRGEQREVTLELVRSASLQGFVRDAPGAPLAGAGLRLHDVRFPARGPLASTRSDARGGFVLADLPPGVYQLQARWPSAEASAAPATLLVELAPGEARVLELRGEPHPAAIHGRLLDGSGSPLAGVRVVCALEEAPGEAPRPPGVWIPWSRVLAQDTTGADGRYRLERLPPASVSVLAGVRRGAGLRRDPAPYAPALAGRFDLAAARGPLDAGTTVLQPGPSARTGPAGE